MSIMRCEKHGAWDSDFYEACPLCADTVPLMTQIIPGDWLHTKYSGGIEVIVPPSNREQFGYDWDMNAMDAMAEKLYELKAKR